LGYFAAVAGGGADSDLYCCFPFYDFKTKNRNYGKPEGGDKWCLGKTE